MFERISVAKAVEMINQEELLIVDIRDANSFNQGHIKDAIHLDNHNIQAFLSEADKSKALIVCCYHGNSSQPAASMFAEQGFKRSYSMDGGMSEWSLSNEVVS